MREIEHRVSDLGIERKIFIDDNGAMTVQRVHNHDNYEQVFKENLESQSDARFAANVRKVAEIPVDIYDAWVSEINALGYHDNETVSAILNHKLSDPDNRKFLCVPSNYRIKKNGF